uniref:Uncharacterized protein n=1 Tax=Salvator merianae TaxID=96440 RepID=A0A8D0BHB7_SALMN
ILHKHKCSHSHPGLSYVQWKIKVTPLPGGQEKLAWWSLRDLWLCSEACRYMSRYSNQVIFCVVFGKGFKWGFAAYVVPFKTENAFNPAKSE